MNRIRVELARPLARYGFAAVAGVAVATGQTGPALVTGGLALAAWAAHRTTRTARRARHRRTRR